MQEQHGRGGEGESQAHQSRVALEADKAPGPVASVVAILVCPPLLVRLIVLMQSAPPQTISLWHPECQGKPNIGLREWALYCINYGYVPLLIP